MKKDERKLLTLEDIRQNLQESVKGDLAFNGVISAILLLLGVGFMALMLSVRDGFQPEYRFIAIGLALLFFLPFFVVAVVLIVRSLIQWRMVRQGRYEVLEDTLVNAVCYHNPKGIDKSDLYFEHYGPFRRTGDYENLSLFGVPYVLVILQDQKETLMTMYSTREYRLDDEKTSDGSHI